MTGKPANITGIGSTPKGLAVHPDDKVLARKLIALGCGADLLPRAAKAIEDASAANVTSLKLDPADTYKDGLSSLPPTLAQQLSHTLLELDLSYNQLCELPAEFFALAQLEVLDLTGNLLWALSPKFVCRLTTQSHSAISTFLARVSLFACRNKKNVTVINRRSDAGCTESRASEISRP